MTEEASFDGFTPKQRLFCHEYLVDLNATQAAIRAGYSEDTAKQIGCENLSKPYLKQKIQELMDLRAKRTEITADRVLVELGKIGFADVRKIFGAGETLLMPSEYDDETAAAVQSVEVVTRATSEEDGEGRKIPEHIHKIKLCDKRAALESLGKNLKLFSDRTEVEHSVTDELAELMREIDGALPGLPNDRS